MWDRGFNSGLVSLQSLAVMTAASLAVEGHLVFVVRKGKSRDNFN